MRLNWTRAHRRWTRQQWNQVVFKDTFRLKYEHYVFGGEMVNVGFLLLSFSGSTMVWGEIPHRALGIQITNAIGII